ncbi:MAG: type III PLP-dependent enzyme [Porticoccaceae bacterium]|nr:type III PLP-dependent enzyme [Porticoccaceae bacterium]|tara:strand:+ start:161 stop:1333 length:1173 start_codon:yes stop_codon:yes gene_type:complete
MDLALKEMDIVLETNQRTVLEKDTREQVAFSMPCTENYDGPVLAVSEQRLRSNARSFIAAMPRVRPHFAVKANPDPEILRIFKEEGCCFEIASSAELQSMVDLDVNLETVFYSNPIKSPASIRQAAAAGIQWFVVDTPEEVVKIAAIKPDAKLYLRSEVSNEGSVWPLAGKFGASSSGIIATIEAAKNTGMQITGVTFHVGSQCANINNWIEGIRSAKNIFAQLEANGWTPELLNLGGGYPIQFTGIEPTIAEIGVAINKELEAIPNTIQIMAEPGRFLVGSAGCLVTQVVGLATRDEKRWLYLDTGTYGGLMELAEDFSSNIVSQRGGETCLWTMAGPTCDSIDVFGEYSLPSSMEVEDLLFITNLGAYCTTCACDFNGFPIPNMVLVD